MDRWALGPDTGGFGDMDIRLRSTFKSLDDERVHEEIYAADKLSLFILVTSDITSFELDCSSQTVFFMCFGVL